MGRNGDRHTSSTSPLEGQQGKTELSANRAH